jgi:hypothetical protein
VKKLQLHFSKAFDADIWEQSLSGNKLLLTTRDSASMQVTFSLLDLADGSFVFEDMAFEESWWLSVYHFYGNVAVFQVYEDTQNIEARSYFALNLTSQEALWSMEDVAAIGRQDDFVQMKQDAAESNPFWLDIRSGEVFDEVPQEYMPSLICDPAMSPLHYTETGPYFETVQRFFKEQLSIAMVSACDYLEYGDHAFVAYHSQVAGELEHFMLVLNKTGEVVFHQKRDWGLKGLVSEAFFIVGERLIFVEGKRTLNSYLIE